MSNIPDLSSIHMTLQEIHKDITNLREQSKTPIKVLMNQKTYKNISPDYEVGEINECFGLPLEINSSVRKYKVCFEENDYKEGDIKMKKYQTWEAIKMLSEDNSLIFQYKRSRLIHDGTHILFLEDNNPVSWYGIPENYEWWLVKQPVAFIEALNAHYNQHKTIYCEIDNRRYTYDWLGGEYKEMKSNEAGGICVKEILEGKWYIEP